MSELKDLMAKGELITLSNDKQLRIQPMTIDEEVEIAGLQKEEKFVEAVRLLVKNAIKFAIPDATDEEINRMNKEDLKKITEKVLEINGLSGDKKPKKD